MKKAVHIMCAVVVASLGSVAMGDDFGTGANRFSIDFVTISGDASNVNLQLGYNPSGLNRMFSDPGDFRIGVYEITTRQWLKFAELSPTPIKGSPTIAYIGESYWSNVDYPTTGTNWYEAAQMINWLNTSTGHHPAYKFTGTQGTSDYAFDTWSTAEADNGTNLYRHKDAFYYLPTDSEWVKAAYWNGATIQDYALKDGDVLVKGDSVSGTGWNYYDGQFALDPEGPWEVGSGSEELNGTYDMMGNLWEFVENNLNNNYDPEDGRAIRGGAYIEMGANVYKNQLASWGYGGSDPNNYGAGYPSSHTFRIASRVPEPATLSLLALGGLAMLRRRR